jgi:6-phosphogluconolactonase
VTNRGADDGAVYSVDSKTGTLTLAEFVPTKGKTPSSLAIDPSGNWLIVTNQASDSVVSFKIDPQTGKLTSTGENLDVATPACVRFLPLN